MPQGFVSSWAATGAAAALLAYRALRPRRSLVLGGSVVLLTGGSRGLGLVLARQLLARRCDVVLCARSADGLAQARRALGPRVVTQLCDVADRGAVELMVEKAVARFGRIDVLINNASIFQVGPLEAMALDDFEQAMAVNFWGTVYATLAVLPHMRARGRGRIVNVTSIGGKVAVPHLLPYDCAKFAALGFSEGLRAELAKDHIGVTTVVPGVMRTGAAENALFKGAREREYAWFAAGDGAALLAMDTERAARLILRALSDGDDVLTLSWPARLLRYGHAAFPSLTLRLLGLLNRGLPEAPPNPPDRATRGGDLGGRPASVRSLLARSAARLQRWAET